MALAISFPDISSVLFNIWGLEIRWYGIAYALSIILGYFIFIQMASTDLATTKILLPKVKDDILIYIAIGILIGGRFGYVLFYHINWIWCAPLQILKTWEGGMSFHGGLIGCAIALYLFNRKHKLGFFYTSDRLLCIAPIGLFLGRVSNFINAELYGRVTALSWGVIFPYTDGLPRHPSQLYEAFVEGIVLLCTMWGLYALTSIKRFSGALTAVFLIYYGVARIILECYREPDSQLGTFMGITMGQLLSFPMIIYGIYLLIRLISSSCFVTKGCKM